jgi:hypothetical protein
VFHCLVEDFGSSNVFAALLLSGPGSFGFENSPSTSSSVGRGRLCATERAYFPVLLLSLSCGDKVKNAGIRRLA